MTVPPGDFIPPPTWFLVRSRSSCTSPPILALSLGLRTIAQVARDLDARTMQLQYLDMLKALGAGGAAKIVVPLEVTGLLAGIGERIAAAGDVGKATLLDACVGPR